MPGFIGVCVLLSITGTLAYRDGTAQQVKFSWDETLVMEPGQSKNLNFQSSESVNCEVTLYLQTIHVHSHNGSTPIFVPGEIHFRANTTKQNVTVDGLFVGQAILKVNGSSAECSDVIPDIGENHTHSKIEIKVVHSYAITIWSDVIGWIYFVAWSVSFYPQVWLNFQRRSVVGLNFDFLALNITGFVTYGIYNIALFWIPMIQIQYDNKHPDGVNPVQVNDVMFSIHSVVLTLIMILQAVIHESGGQKVSKIGIGILSFIDAGLFVLLFVAIGNKISWLTYIDVLAYVKLGITLIKYMPQALMNYRRKSTVGWSIGAVLLDCAGGVFSILQMILESYNNDEWDLVFGDPTKFGLGLFSIIFDVIFMIQHYVLYHPKRRKIVTEDEGLLDSDSDISDIR